MNEERSDETVDRRGRPGRIRRNLGLRHDGQLVRVADKVVDRIQDFYH